MSDHLDTGVDLLVVAADMLTAGIGRVIAAHEEEGRETGPELLTALDVLANAMKLASRWKEGDYGPGRRETAKEIHRLMAEALMLSRSAAEQALADE